MQFVFQRPRIVGLRRAFGWEAGHASASTRARLSLIVLVAVCLAGYGASASRAPLQGEESRWAQGARWMLWTGDWIVPRQQGHVFAERPPLNSWLMAAIGLVRGDVDEFAIRVPSVLAIALTALLLYWYGRRTMSSSAGLIAAAAFLSFGQVLQLGRRGESEAVFTFFVSASLLVWHAMWIGGVRPWKCWSAGFALAALGALTKGIQAPIYFVAGTTGYLCWIRDWRALVNRSYAIGIGIWLAIVGSWFVPFWIMTDTRSAIDIWTGLAGDRIGVAGLVKHMAIYPWETLACLLPWSPLFLQFMYREVRKEMRAAAMSPLGFLIASVVLTYPSVWCASGARGRYYMPMYPLLALIIAYGVAKTIQSERGWARSGLLLWEFIMAGLAVLLPIGLFALGNRLPQIGPAVSGLSIQLGVCLALGVVVTFVVWRNRRLSRGWESGFVAIASWLVLATGWLYVPAQATQLHGLRQEIQHIRKVHQIAKLQSIGPIYHRFAYYHGEPITEHPWPETRDQVPADLDYFCFDVLRNDTNELHACGRGRTWRPVPGRVPFRWVEIARFKCDPLRRDQANRVVVIGRVVRTGDGRIAWCEDYPLIDTDELLGRWAKGQGERGGGMTR